MPPRWGFSGGSLRFYRHSAPLELHFFVFETLFSMSYGSVRT